MKFKLSVILAIFLFIFSNLALPASGPFDLGDSSGPEKNHCTKVIEILDKNNGTPTAEIDIHVTHDISNIQFLGQVKSPDGDVQFKIKKKGDRWGLGKGLTDRAPEGDPRWLLQILGGPAQKALGYEKIDEVTMLIPDGNLLTKEFEHLEKIDPTLGKGIRYYETGEKKVNFKEYMRKFIDERSIPVDPENTHRIHDTSFHASAILIPPKLLDQSRFIAKELEGFYDFIEKKLTDQLGKEATPEEKQAIKTITRLLRVYSVAMVDGGTGTLAPAILESIKRRRNYSENPYYTSMKASYSNLLFQGPLVGEAETKSNAAFGSPERAILFMPQHFRDVLRITLSKEAHEKISSAGRTLKRLNLGADFLEQLAKEYCEERKTQDPDFSKSPFSEDEVCNDILNRVGKLRSAIEKASQKPH